MTNEKFDVIVLGAGPAGTPCAMELAQLGKKVLLVDAKGKLGGECLFDGCIPSKIIEKSAEYFALMSKLESFGVKIVAEPTLVWKNIVQKKEMILEKRSREALGGLERLSKVTFKKGVGRFLANHQFEIENAAGEHEIVGFEKAVIATGGRGFRPALTGNGAGKIITNTEFFDRMEWPSSMVIIGGGAIGVELAQMLSKLGARITILESGERIVNMLDMEVGDYLFEKLKEMTDIKFELGVNILEINEKDNDFEVVFENDNKRRAVKAEKVFVSAGRRPNVEGLNLEAVGVKHSPRGIEVDSFLQTANPDIYAAGDVIVGPQFAHTASYEADIVAKNILSGNTTRVDFDKNSWVLFSDPNVASAGLTEAQAKERGLEVVSGKYDYRLDAKSQIDEEAFGFLKFVVEKNSRQIIGVHIVTPDAQVNAGEAALIVAKKVTLSELAETIHPHPTLSESFTKLAQAMLLELKLKK